MLLVLEEKIMFISIGAGGTLESSVEFESKGNVPVYRRRGRKLGRRILFFLMACWCEIDLLYWGICC